MLIILVGASGTGKSTLEKEICEISDYEKIISYTTRYWRDDEVNGVDYYFVDRQQFFEHDLEDFAEYEEYSMGRFYGTKKNQYEGYKSQIVVLTPHGVRQLKKNMPWLNTYVVYMTAPLKDKAIRYLNRINEVKISDLNELVGRTERDFGMFAGFEDEADLIAGNGDGVDVSELAWYILDKVEKLKTDGRNKRL